MSLVINVNLFTYIMQNPLKDPIKNPFKILYEGFWVPVFGRALNLFTILIEGKKPKEKQTFDLRDKKE